MTEDPDPNETITLAQAGRFADLRLSTVQTLRRMGLLHCVKLGRDWTLTRGELHRYLQGRRRGRVKPLPPTYRTPRGLAPITNQQDRGVETNGDHLQDDHQQG